MALFQVSSVDELQKFHPGMMNKQFLIRKTWNKLLKYFFNKIVLSQCLKSIIFLLWIKCVLEA